MTINNALRSASKGMTAERFRMDVISSNIANANTVKIGDQDPYRRREVLLRPSEDGVDVVEVTEDQTEFPQKYDPGNPNANESGYVTMSNVEPIAEMVNMMTASRAYEANIQAFNSAKGMIQAALEIGRA
jgi:flagellar basal-body rod protein FlgC